MRRLNPILIVIVVGMVASASGHADTVLIATLTNAQEVSAARARGSQTSTGDARPASFGTAVFTLNESQTPCRSRPRSRHQSHGK